MTKEINLNNAWRVTLFINGDNKKPFIQFIEAETLDIARKKALNTFDARLYNLSHGTTIIQKACNKTIEPKKLTFGFGNGHITIPGGKNIFDMLKQAQADKFTGNKAITEITTAMSEYL